MATRRKLPQIDFQALIQAGKAQFQGLDPREPGQWPILPKVGLWVVTLIAVVILGRLLVISDEAARLDVAVEQEPKLKTEYRQKLGLAVNLGELRKQKEQVQEYVTQLEKQLPGKAEMDALLSDINQAGVGRGLQFDLFRPGQVVVKDYYAELPIAIRVTGRFHDIGAFAGDIANLSRIVTLHNMAIQPVNKDASGNLSLEATARTYRYLDADEIAENQKANTARGANKKGAP